jgi:hypothetical protein
MHQHRNPGPRYNCTQLRQLPNPKHHSSLAHTCLDLDECVPVIKVPHAHSSKTMSVLSLIPLIPIPLLSDPSISRLGTLTCGLVS